MNDSSPTPPLPLPPSAPPPRLETAPAESANAPASRPANPPTPPALPARECRRGRGCLIFFALAALLLGGLFVVLTAVAVISLAGTRHWFAGMHPAKLREEFISGNLRAREKIVVIDVKGMILESNFYDGASSDLICAALQAAAADDSVKAVILDVDSPGGEITASDEIHHALLQFRDDTGKPVVTCMHALGASGAYYIAAGSDYIIANRLTLTGSIGVIIPHYVYKDLLDKVGIKSEPYKSGEMKDMLNGGRDPVSAKEKEYVQQMVMESFHEFAEIVAEGRAVYKGKVGDVLAAPFADGRVLTGREALRYGLIDELGYFDDAVSKARELADAPEAKIVRLRRGAGLAELLFSSENALLRSHLSSPLPAVWTQIKPGQPYFLLPSCLP